MIYHARYILISHTVTLRVYKSLREWRANGLKHSFAGVPAATSTTRGWRRWCDHGRLHRLGGLPAVEWGDGEAEYFLYGEHVCANDAIIYERTGKFWRPTRWTTHCGNKPAHG